MTLARHEIVLVLRLDQKLDYLRIVLHINGDLDYRQPFKNAQKFLGFLLNEFLGCFGQVPMTGGNLDLHGLNSFHGKRKQVQNLAIRCAF